MLHISKHSYLNFQIQSEAPPGILRDGKYEFRELLSLSHLLVEVAVLVLQLHNYHLSVAGPKAEPLKFQPTCGSTMRVI